MAVNVSNEFHRTSTNPIDDSLVLSKEDMRIMNPNLMPEKYFAMCTEDGCLYIYDKLATASEDTGNFIKLDSSQTATFTEALTRANIASGEKLSVIFGKIKKYFTDLKTVAFSNSYNDLDNLPTLGTAAAKDSTNNVTENSIDLVESGAVYTAISSAIEAIGLSSYATLESPAFTGTPTAPTATRGTNTTQIATTTFVQDAIDALPKPMIMQGTVGTNGTIDWGNDFPSPSSENVGYTYKVITAHDSAPICKVGDLIVSNGSEWIVVPSGDESFTDTWRSIKVNGTEKLGNNINTGAIDFENGDATTVSFDSAGNKISVSHNDTSSQASVTNSGRTYIQSVTLDDYGHVTALSSGTETVTNTDRYVNSAAFADDSTNNNVKMTLTRAGSDTTQVTANIPKVSSSSAGVAPKGATVSTQSQSTKFLREDGTWASPSYTSTEDLVSKNNTYVDGGIGYINGDEITTINGNAATASVADKWTTARTLTIGATEKSVDGSANVSWNTTEINRVTLNSSLGGRVVIALCKLSDSGVDLNLGWAGNIYASRGGQDDFTQWANINIAAIKGLAYGFKYTLITSTRNNYSQISQSNGFRACRFQYTVNGTQEWYGGLEFYNSWGNRKFDIDGIYTRSSFTPFIVQYATMSGSTATATNNEIYNSIDFSATYCIENSISYTGTSTDRYRFHYDGTSTWASYAWHKVAYKVVTPASSDYVLTLLVSNSANAKKCNGILRCRVRRDADSNGNPVLNTTETSASWVINNGIDTNDFILVWDVTNITIELWCKISARYNGYQFVVLDSGTRTDNGNFFWTLCDNVNGNGSATYTQSDTIIKSKNNPIDIDFGGRNLVRNSADMSLRDTSAGIIGWRLSESGTLTHQDINDAPISLLKGAIRLTNSGSSSIRSGAAQDNLYVSFKNGDYITESFYIRASVEFMSEMQIQPFYKSASIIASIGITKTITTDWQYIKATTRVSADYTGTASLGYVYVNSLPAGAWYEVCGMKVEWGGTATDWTPAIEDIQTPYIATVNTRDNIANGENLSTLFGKIKKWFTDLADLAFINKPSSSQTTTFLRGDGTWVTPYDSGTKTQLEEGQVETDEVWSPKILSSYIADMVASSNHFKGSFNATNGTINETTDTLTTVANAVGDSYTCSVAGTYATVAFNVGDSLVFKRAVSAGTAPTSSDFTAIHNNTSVTDNNPTLSWGTQSKVGTVSGVDLHVTMPSNPNTWRAIKVNGTQQFSTSTSGSAVDFVEGNNVSLTYNSTGNKITIAATDTTYSQGDGITIDANNNINCNLNSTTSLGTIGTTDNLYAVGVDSNGELCTLVDGVFTSSADGLAPMASDANKLSAESSVGNYYLCADGKYRQLPSNAFNNTTYDVATQSANGLMSATDKTKLDNLTIGGRNLLVYADAEADSVSGLEATRLSDGWFHIEGTITETSAGLPYPKFLYDETTTPIKGGQCTLSIETRNLTLSEDFKVQIYRRQVGQSTGGQSYYITESNGKITINLTESSTQYFVLRVTMYKTANATGTVVNGDIRFKLERGNVATDWTPAPEDLVAKENTYVSNGKGYINGTEITTISGNSSTATKLATARSLKTKLDSITAVSFDGSADQNAIPVVGTLPVANGGTGATSAVVAEYNILGSVQTVETEPNDNRYIALRNQTVSNTNGTFRWTKMSSVWDYFKGKLLSDTGVNISGNAATATVATKLGTSSFGNQIKPFYLNAGVPTACDIYRYHYDSTSDYASYAWHKVAYAVAAAQTDKVVTFFVTTGNGVARNGILKCRVRWDAESAFNSSGTKLNWAINNGIDVNDFVFVWKSPNVELWCKIPERYGGYHFTVLDSGNRTANGVLNWTLCDSVNGHGSASYTTEGTVITSTNATLNNNINGTINGYSIGKSVPSDAVFTDHYDWTDITNKPTFFSGNYNDLTNKPTIPAAQVNSDWNATSGKAQILNKPTIPTKVSDLTNDSGFTNNVGTVTSVKVGTTSYNPSSGVVSLPAYPSVPTKVSDLTNDSGFTTNVGTITKVGNTSSGNVSVSSSNNTASWGSAVTVGSVGGVDLKFTMPSNPNSDTKVTQTQTDTTSVDYDVLLSYSDSSTTSNETNAVRKSQSLTYNPKSGRLQLHKTLSYSDLSTAISGNKSLNIVTDVTGISDVTKGFRAVSIELTGDVSQPNQHLNGDTCALYVKGTNLGEGYALYVEGFTYMNGTLRVNSTIYGTSIYQSSDDRKKNYIGDFHFDINKVGLIPLKEFEYKDDESKTKHIGTSAQSLEKVLPQLVNTDNDGFKSVEYSKLSIVALDCIKQLQEKIEALEKRIVELEKR